VVVGVDVAGLKRGFACVLIVLSMCALLAPAISYSLASFSIGGLRSVSGGRPYWVRPGAYAVYESLTPLVLNFFFRSWVDGNGSLHEDYYQLTAYVKLRWTILKVEGDLALVNVTLTLADPNHRELRGVLMHFISGKDHGGMEVHPYYPDPQPLEGLTFSGMGYVNFSSDIIVTSKLVWVNLINSSIIVGGRQYPESFFLFTNPYLISENKSIYLVKTRLYSKGLEKIIRIYSNFTSLRKARTGINDDEHINVALLIFRDLLKRIPQNPLTNVSLGRVYVTYCYTQVPIERNLSTNPLTMMTEMCSEPDEGFLNFYDVTSGMTLATVLYSISKQGETPEISYKSLGMLYRLFNITDVIGGAINAGSLRIRVGDYVISYSPIYLVDTNVPLGRPVFGGVTGVSSSEWLGLSLSVVVLVSVSVVVLVVLDGFLGCLRRWFSRGR